MKRLLLPAALLLWSLPLRAQPSMVILVRHAERDTAPPRDPGLTAAGQARARALLQALAGARVNSVITTQFQRTKLTAKPLADSLGLPMVVVAASAPVSAHAQAVAAAVRARPAGEVVLVVGHSNTVPAILAALGGPVLPDLCDNQYSNLYVLELSTPGSPRFLHASYGAADPPDPACRTMR